MDLLTLQGRRTLDRNTSADTDLRVLLEWIPWIDNRLKDLRKRERLDSDRKVADFIGISHTTLGNLQDEEKLRTNQPSTETCHKLAAAFKVNPDLVLYLARHRDVDPRKTLKVREDVAQLQKRVSELNEIQDESELQKNIELLNRFLDGLFKK